MGRSNGYQPRHGHENARIKQSMVSPGHSNEDPPSTEPVESVLDFKSCPVRVDSHFGLEVIYVKCGGGRRW